MSAPASRSVLASDAVLARLGALHPKKIDLSLGRLERLLGRLGNPERHIPPVIHVAGTNGKGSVIAYLRAILEAAGNSVHVYTSPHLVRFHERIRLAGTLITEAQLEAALADCEQANDGAPITFFEITTAAAFHTFSQVQADITLLEVGLGGLYDATNVITAPLASVVTPISMDHQDFLGDDLLNIAREKAGILKANIPAIIGPQQPKVLKTLRQIADQRHAPAFCRDRDWQLDPASTEGSFIYSDADTNCVLPVPNLVGRHQIDNAGTAVAVVQRLKDLNITEAQIREGLVTAQWPGRLQKLTTCRFNKLFPPHTEIWLDGGHNPAAAQALAANFCDPKSTTGQPPGPLHLVSCLPQTKDPVGFLEPFAACAQEAIFIPVPGDHPSHPPEILAQLALDMGIPATAAHGLEEALRVLAERTLGRPPAHVLICGSLFLVGETLRLLGETPQ